MDIAKVVEETLYYASTHLDLKKDDEIYFRNILLGELQLTKPYEGEIDKELISSLKVPDTLIDSFTSYLCLTLHKEEGEAERFAIKLMGFLTPNPSVVNQKFYELEKDSDRKALDYLYDLSIYNYYIQKTKVDKNLLWVAKDDTTNRFIEVSINLSKPEKNVKDIKKLLDKNVAITYPKCLLCLDNVGFYGDNSHAARENIRVIPLKLNNDNWYLQYSPYGYYNMHCIVFNKAHSNMKIDNSSFKALLDFVDRFPSFFLGSNAELPIVGGSILNHEHFQGGEHLLPVMKMSEKKKAELPSSYKETTLSILDWYNSVLLIKGKNKAEIARLFNKIHEKWNTYDDKEVDIISSTDGVRHNTLNPIVRKKDGCYYVYLILRNNRCDKNNPEGIFHAHQEYYHIKKENIGLIEAMGLFVLPARLVRQFEEIKDVVNFKLATNEINKKYPDLIGFEKMIDYVKERSSTDDVIHDYVNQVCYSILENTAVFKHDEKGCKAFDKFLLHIGE